MAIADLIADCGLLIGIDDCRLGLRIGIADSDRRLSIGMTIVDCLTMPIGQPALRHSNGGYGAWLVTSGFAGLFHV